MSCEGHRSVLIDVALGAPAPPALAAHLAECEGCRAALDTEQQFVGRLDAEVEDSLHLQPSLGFLPRVRQSQLDAFLAPGESSAQLAEANPWQADSEASSAVVAAVKAQDRDALDRAISTLAHAARDIPS